MNAITRPRSVPSFFSPLILLGSLAMGAPAVAGPHVLELNYEWSQSPGGPWSPVPPGSLQALGDGSVRVQSDADQTFFRLNIDEAGEGGTLPVLPLSGLSTAVREKADRLFLGIRGTEGETAEEWADGRFAPFVCPIYSPWNTSGVPDFLEFKVRVEEPAPPGTGLFGGWGKPHECDRGYFLMSLTPDEPLVSAFASSGPTMAEQLVERCRGQSVARIVQFGPTFVAAEDARGGLVGFLGHAPTIFPEADYAKFPLGISRSGGSGQPSPPKLAPIDYQGPLSFTGYAQFKAAFVGSSFLRKRHLQRAALTAFDHLAFEGKAPTLTVAKDKSASFPALEDFIDSFIDQEDERLPVATITFGRAGVLITAHTAGAWRVTFTKARGERVRYMLNITDPLVAANCVEATATWTAGDWGDQPRYRQLDRARWCPKVGCGPVALQILFSWWERERNVPSAFYRRQHDPQSSELLQSLRSVDAPFESSNNDANIIHWYDYWHEACDVICPPGTDEGATMPNELGEAFENFLLYVCSSVFAFANTGNSNPLVGCGWHWEVDYISDDWDESGVRLANEIKNHRPGIAVYLEMPHYMVAYAYRRHRSYCDYPTPWQRFFRCNMGWGSSVEWKNAYDIDGCWLLEMWQQRVP